MFTGGYGMPDISGELYDYYKRRWVVGMEDSRPLRYELVRDMTPGEKGFYGDKSMVAGQQVYRFTGNHYGCIPVMTGTLVSNTGPQDYPFYEIPTSCLRVVDDVLGNEPRTGD